MGYLLDQESVFVSWDRHELWVYACTLADVPHGKELGNLYREDVFLDPSGPISANPREYMTTWFTYITVGSFRFVYMCLIVCACVCSLWVVGLAKRHRLLRPTSKATSTETVGKRGVRMRVMELGVKHLRLKIICWCVVPLIFRFVDGAHTHTISWNLGMVQTGQRNSWFRYRSLNLMIFQCESSFHHACFHA